MIICFTITQCINKVILHQSLRDNIGVFGSSFCNSTKLATKVIQGVYFFIEGTTKKSPEVAKIQDGRQKISNVAFATQGLRNRMNSNNETFSLAFSEHFK